MKQNMKVFIPATLGMLTAFGPFVTDFYLPVLPEMTGYFHTTPALASMSLTAGMIGLAAGQLFIGPLTDKYGRKRILVGSMLLFVVASLLCIFSGDIFMFNAMRVLQGLAGAGGIDLHADMLRADAAAFDGHSPRQRARQCRCCQCHLRCLRLCCRCPFESACRHWRHNRHFRPRHGMRSRCLPPVYPAVEQQAARRCGMIKVVY